MVCCATFTKCDFHFFDVYALKLLHFETVYVFCDVFYHMTFTLWKCNVIKLSLYETLKLNWCYILWCLRRVLLCFVATTLHRSPLEIHIYICLEAKIRAYCLKSYTSLVLREASLKRNTCTQVPENMDLNVLYNHNYLF
jgi:hypothetical protein